MVKLYISPCPNDTFMFDAIINKRIDLEGWEFEVSYFDIEELNARCISAEADITKLSCAVLPLIDQNYTVSDSGAALGRGNGPLLVRRKGDSSPIRRVAVPGEHTTANALMCRLFPDVEERVPMLFSQIAEAVERGDFDAGVLIHEGRFVYAERNLELVADLGLLWEERTALPLPLGAIAVRKGLDVDGFSRLLKRSIEYAFAHPAESREFIKEHAQEMENKVIDSHIALFVNEFSLSLGALGREAIDVLIIK